MRALAGFLAVAALAGCSTPSPAPAVPCSPGFLGDPSMPLDFEITGVTASYDAVPLADGGAVAILVPPQGGRVVFAGVRATNVNGCGLQLTGALRDTPSNQVRFDSRTINLIPTGDGWGTTGTLGASVSGTISNFANIPVCPNQWSTRNVNDNDYVLEVTVTDSGGRTMQKDIRVTPSCGNDENTVFCHCVCQTGYILGNGCPAPTDAGEGDAP
jgi:hypothetical protein